MKQSGVYKLEGVLQHYQWGGTDFLPALLQQRNEKKQPWAEYWLGIHPKGTALVHTPQGPLSLADFLEQHPHFLGEEVQQQFGALPFLFKLLDVKEMLSIQLHPTRSAAQKGYAQEEAANVPRLDPKRTYKDQNHKPELMVALTDFWLLHGFKDESAIAQTLQTVSAWEALVPTLNSQGITGLYERVMKASNEEVFAWLDPLYQDLSQRQTTLTPATPDYWAWRAFQQYATPDQHDRGIFSIYWFNLVFLSAGEGIFQGAGIPHAYLRGINVELMANSDNVIRGGLTPKHVDVAALLANINFSPVIPRVLRGKAISTVGTDYPVPVPDFALRKYEINAEQESCFKQKGPGIYIVMDGKIKVNGLAYFKGEAFFLADQTETIIKNNDDETATIFAATV